MTKTTITEQVNAIEFATLTEEQFNFLKERALKSVRKSSKSTGERKPTKMQVENEGYKAEILKVLADSEGMTATQVGTAFGWTGSQKASALLKQLVEAGQVTKSNEGKAIIFRVA